MKRRDWWRGAVFYQIYPRSYMDSNGDGIGDLPGITSKLDHVASLGVDAVWISPFYKSPMKDFGYDISDYRAVDPIFGTNEDFDALIDRAHRLGLKIVIDMVLNHTSDKHPWFVESRAGRDNEKSDWYVWADAKEDGSPPNNWQSVFGGSAWTFDTQRAQYYLHNFLWEQPDLNMHNPDVQDELLDMMHYWLNRGVDGFRLDVVNYYFHDPLLRDNPPRKKDGLGFISGYEGPSPLNMQLQLYNKSRPENLYFLGRIRTLTDSFPGAMTVAEVGDEDAMRLSATYTSGPGRLNTAYNTQIMGGTGKALTADLIRAALEKFLSCQSEGWPAWAFSNHDVVRAVSRWGRHDPAYETDPAFAKMLLSLLCSLYGTVFIYQGEELALPESNIPREKLQDPWGISMWPKWPGRDGCRTPMPWDDRKDHAGFTQAAADPWLPIDKRHLPLCVARQEEDENSVLLFTRRFLRWRKQHPALMTGAIRFLDLNDDALIGFARAGEGEDIFCLFNLSNREKIVTTPKPETAKTIFDAGEQSGRNEDGKILMPPFGIFYSASGG